MKIVIAVVAVALIALLAAIYVPKIKANMAKERAERMANDFAREVGSMQSELPSLYEKYQLKSLDEPIAFKWTDDSMRYVQSFMPYFGSDEYKAKAITTLESQRAAIENHRRADFDRLLVNEFKQATDSIAMQLKTALPDPTEEQLLIVAGKWYNQMK